MLTYFFLSIPPTVWIIAAFNDVLEFKIPNWLNLFLIVSYPMAALYFGLTYAEIGLALGLGLIVLAIGFTLFCFKVLGAGDVKLLAASALWIGPLAFASFALKVALIGGGVALLLMSFKRTPLLPIYAQAPWVMKLHSTDKNIPYGLPITIGGLLTLPEMAIFSSIFAI